MRPVLFLVVFMCHQVYADNLTLRISENAQSTANPPGYVLGITVQNMQQLDALLNRADKLKEQFSPDQYSRIALVLHGNELNLFRKKNYSKNMDIVNKARLLDSQNLIDIKACQTVMRNLQIDQDELPDFIEQVPLAPVEIDRLEREKGFTRL